MNSRLSFALFLAAVLMLFTTAYADHHKKSKDSDALTECTIQSSEGGGGCKGGFKRVCQKLKNGGKCCGCVPDNDAKPAQTPAQEPKFTCDMPGVLNYTMFAANDAEAKAKFAAQLKADNLTPKGSVTCTRVQ